MRFIGSKVLLLEEIKKVIDDKGIIANSFCDIFSGTASVARYFKEWYEVYSNDLLYFSYCLQYATVENDSVPLFENLKSNLGITDPIDYFNGMNSSKMEVLENEKRFFQNNYAPSGNRMYVTNENALKIDFARNTVENWRIENLISYNEYIYLVACIVEGIPFVSNISGTYGAFHKTWDKRAFKKFELFRLDVITNNKNNKTFNKDSNELVKEISGDILYIDPPYNQRQYEPNYHVLETAAKYDFPEIRGVTGQRVIKESRSQYCSKINAIDSFKELIENAKFKHILVSYSTDGIMSLEEMEKIMKTSGIEKTFEITYIPYRRYKSRNRQNRGKDKLHEVILYVEKEVN